MKVAAIATLSLCLASSGVALAQAQRHNGKEVAQAAKACMTAQGQPLSHPSDGCWVAYDAAMKRRDFELALSYVRTSCQKHGRADFCLFTSQLDEEPGHIVKVGAGGGSKRMGEALLRAGQVVKPLDYEDGERGVVLRELMRPERK